MANEAHVERLKAGAKEWNQWRGENTGNRPDLGHADLSHADLSHTDLSHADLGGARLMNTILRGALLNHAYLSGADLSGADLSGADLSHADLWGVELISTHLIHANLTSVDFYEASFGNTNLSDARGLDSCNHGGPSTLDGRTIARSGPLPLEFLRGCGLSDWEIEASKLHQSGLSDQEKIDITYRIAHLTTGDAVQYASCFISYSHKDEPFCKALHERLQNAGVRAWFALDDMQGGQRIAKQVDRAIQFNDKLLIILTENSIHSPWVQREIRQALAREGKEGRDILFPIRLIGYPAIQAWECFDSDSGIDLAKAVRSYHIPGDFEHWQEPAAFDAAFQKLLRDLRAEDAASQA